MKLLTMTAAALAAGTVVSGAAFAQAQPGQQLAGLQVAEKPQLGRYLTDAQGRTLYMFTADRQGAKQSSCSGECAQAWPPATTIGQTQVGPQVQQDLLSTIARQDGSQQVTYNGYPLYYFVRDQAPGQVNGQDVEGFGGEWYALAPDGQVIRSEQRAEQPR